MISVNDVKVVLLLCGGNEALATILAYSQMKSATP